MADHDPELLDADTVRALGRLSLASLDAVIAGVAGSRANQTRGSAIEFADYREYTRGDDLRQLDWHVYLRLRELRVKVGPQEGHIEVDLLIDTSRSMDSGTTAARPGKLRHAQRVAAALGAVALLRFDAVRIWALNDGAAEPSPRLDTPRMLATLERELTRLEPGRATDLSASIESYLRGGATADLAVLISDALVPAASLAQTLDQLDSGARASAFVHVVDGAESSPLPRGMVVLRDRETGRQLELSLTDSVAEAYERRFEHFRQGVETACADAGVRYLLAPTDVPVLDLLSKSARLAGIVAQ